MRDPLADLGRTEGVPSALAAARSAVEVVLRDRGMRQVTPDDVARAALASARASAALEGWPGEALETAATARMLSELPALAGIILTSPGQALARMHAVWGRGLVADETLGRPDSDPLASARLVGVYELIAHPSQAPVIVKAAVVHAELYHAAPFARGNGVVARAAEQAILMAGGLDPHGVIVVPEGHRAAGPGYATALAAYEKGSVVGVRRWLEHCAAAITRGAEHSPLAARPIRRRAPGSPI